MTPDTSSAAEHWQLEGDAPASYERYLVPALFAPWLDELLELLALRAGDALLDVACGTGVVARGAVERTDGVSATGVDVNAGMLAVARGLAPAVTWREADAAALPYPDAAFDAVVCQQGLQFVTDPPAAVAEMRRVLRPGGRLGIAVWRGLAFSPGFAALVAALERHAGPDAAAVMRGPFALGDAAAVRGMLTDAGFADVRIRVGVRLARFPSAEEFVRREAVSTPLAPLVAALGEARLAALVDDVGAALAAYADDEGVAFPLENHLVAARR